MSPISYARHQFPPDVIRHAVWLYLRFTLSYRDIEDLLAERGLDVSYERVRRWVLKFGPVFARMLAIKRVASVAFSSVDKHKQHSSLEARVFELFDAEDQHCEAEADWCVEDHPCEAGRDFRWELLVPFGFEPLQCNHWEEARKLL
jgi:putative transposase